MVSMISRAVVISWAWGFAGFANWRAMKAPGVSRAICSAFATAPAIPSSRGVRTISAP